MFDLLNLPDYVNLYEIAKGGKHLSKIGIKKEDHALCVWPHIFPGRFCHWYYAEPNVEFYIFTEMYILPPGIIQ